MDRDEVWRVVGAERLALADWLESLDPDSLDTPSLCDAWTVRDVFAHLTVSPLSTRRDLVAAFVAGRGRFDQSVLLATRPALAKHVDVVAADLRRTATWRTHPLGTTHLEPLTDVLVHGQDIAVPLGVDREMPLEAAAVSARRVWQSVFPFFPQRRLRGLELVATDSDFRVGRGRPVRGRTQDLLLLLTGRYACVGALSGEGTAALPATA